MCVSKMYSLNRKEMLKFIWSVSRITCWTFSFHSRQLIVRYCIAQCNALENTLEYYILRLYTRHCRWMHRIAVSSITLLLCSGNNRKEQYSILVDLSSWLCCRQFTIFLLLRPSFRMTCNFSDALAMFLTNDAISKWSLKNVYKRDLGPKKYKSICILATKCIHFILLYVQQ